MSSLGAVGEETREAERARRRPAPRAHASASRPTSRRDVGSRRIASGGACGRSNVSRARAGCYAAWRRCLSGLAPDRDEVLAPYQEAAVGRLVAALDHREDLAAALLPAALAREPLARLDGRAVAGLEELDEALGRGEPPRVEP